MKRSTWAVSIVLSLAAGSALAEDAATKALTWHVDAEANAGLVALGGFGANLAFKPGTSKQMRFEVGVLYLDIPQFGLPSAAGPGWKVHDNAVLGGFQYYFFRPERGGFFAALMGVYQERTITRAGQTDAAHLQQFMISPGVGYEWFPFDKLGLYVEPNLVVAFRVAQAGQPVVGGSTLDLGAVLPLPGVSLGWEL